MTDAELRAEVRSLLVREIEDLTLDEAREELLRLWIEGATAFKPLDEWTRKELEDYIAEITAD